MSDSSSQQRTGSGGGQPTEIDARLLAILACPCEHHAPVEQAAGALRCTRCATEFPVRDGIPVMLLDEAVPGPAGIGAELADPPSPDLGSA